MGLDFKLTKIKDHETVCWIGEGDDARMNPKTEAIIFMTMFTDVGWGLSDGNIEEFIARATLWEKVNGALVGNQDGPMLLTREDMLAHVGLWTNVAGRPREEFLAKLFRQVAPKAGEDPFADAAKDDDDDFDWYGDEDEEFRAAG
jgi:hypothetical protein